MLSSKVACSYCHIIFALAEKRVENKYGSFHPDCNNARERKHRLRELIIRHAIETGMTLKVVPRRIAGG